MRVPGVVRQIDERLLGAPERRSAVANDHEGDVKTQGKDGTQEVVRIAARVA